MPLDVFEDIISRVMKRMDDIEQLIASRDSDHPQSQVDAAQLRLLGEALARVEADVLHLMMRMEEEEEKMDHIMRGLDDAQSRKRRRDDA
jgi:hypothetical protein